MTDPIPSEIRKCKHNFEEHCVTEINGAGVQREIWLECTKCHETRSDEGEPIEHPRADCDGCSKPDCPCNSESPIPSVSPAQTKRRTR